MELSRECPVCFDLYSSDRKPLISSCGHSLCEVCLVDILRKIPLCPLCNSELPADRKLFIINYSLIPQSSPPRQMKNSGVDYDFVIKKLEKEIKFHEETSKTLNNILADLNRNWETSQSEIKDFIDLWLSTLEATRNSLINENFRLKAENEDKVKKKQREIFGVLEKRKKLLNSVLESQRKNKELDPIVSSQLSSLEKVKSYEIELVRHNFSSKAFQLNPTVLNDSLSSFKQHMQKFQFDFEIEKEQNNPSLARQEVLDNKHQFSSDSRPEPRKNNFGREINEKPIFNQQERLVHHHADRKGFNQPEIPARLEIQKNPRENHLRGFDYNDPNITLKWFIQVNSSEVQLPEYANGQIERVRITNKKQIKIIREGTAKFLADLVKMEYHKLDTKGSIIPRESCGLVARALNNN